MTFSSLRPCHSSRQTQCRLQESIWQKDWQPRGPSVRLDNDGPVWYSSIYESPSWESVEMTAGKDRHLGPLAKLVYAQVLGTCSFGSEGSNPLWPTMYDAKVRGRERADEKRRILREYLVKVGCADCGYNEHHSALEFDHLPGQNKYKNVMAMCWDAWPKIWKEVAKCEVVCANCHAVRTFNRRMLR